MASGRKSEGFFSGAKYYKNIFDEPPDSQDEQFGLCFNKDPSVSSILAGPPCPHLKIKRGHTWESFLEEFLKHKKKYLSLGDPKIFSEFMSLRILGSGCHRETLGLTSERFMVIMVGTRGLRYRIFPGHHNFCHFGGVKSNHWSSVEYVYPAGPGREGHVLANHYGIISTVSSLEDAFLEIGVPPHTPLLIRGTKHGEELAPHLAITPEENFERGRNLLRSHLWPRSAGPREITNQVLHGVSARARGCSNFFWKLERPKFQEHITGNLRCNLIISFLREGENGLFYMNFWGFGLPFTFKLEGYSLGPDKEIMELVPIEEILWTEDLGAFCLASYDRLVGKLREDLNLDFFDGTPIFPTPKNLDGFLRGSTLFPRTLKEIQLFVEGNYHDLIYVFMEGDPTCLFTKI